MRWENYVLLFLFTIPFVLSGQRYELSPDRDLRISDSTCVNLFEGATVNLIRGTDCEANLFLSNEFGTVNFINTSADSILYTFTTPGTYVAFCGASAGSIAISSMCFVVSANPVAAIPTLDQWGMIILGLSLLVLMVISYRMKERLKYPLQT